jgi:metal-responsive CopG/Arc/MetJ family transcriptional regulator
MKKKISITLSFDALASLDKLAGSKRLRSVVIEEAIRSYLRQQASAVAEANDLQLINAAAEKLNIEVADVLEYAFALTNRFVTNKSLLYILFTSRCLPFYPSPPVNVFI